MEFLLLSGLIAWKSSFGSIRVLSTRTGVQDSPYTLIVFMRDMLTDRSAKSWLALENLGRRVCRGLPSPRPLCTCKLLGLSPRMQNCFGGHGRTTKKKKNNLFQASVRKTAIFSSISWPCPVFAPNCTVANSAHHHSLICWGWKQQAGWYGYKYNQGCVVMGIHCKAGRSLDTRSGCRGRPAASKKMARRRGVAPVLAAALVVAAFAATATSIYPSIFFLSSGEPCIWL